MKHQKNILIFLLVFANIYVNAQDTPKTFKNPILSGFNSDPSICRVNDDYYLVTSSTTWYPGLPVYHSKDLVNWKVIGHAIARPGMVNMHGVDDNYCIWAPTIRYHNGLFYIITNAYKSGGNFYITATNPAGPWSDPVWLKDAPGIDPSLFWDDDGKCYYTGNHGDFKKSWTSQVAVWLQEIDLKQQKLVGERKTITYGHAANAAYSESPHIYKIDGRYLLLMAEGGSGPSRYHAVTSHHSDSLWGPYLPAQVNPVLSHRQFGKKYPIQNIGHADLVQTQNGEWYSVVLGNRNIDGLYPLSRETFLCKVDFENETPIYNAGYGKVLMEQERPNLPWTPVYPEFARDEFDAAELSNSWYFIRIPRIKFHNVKQGQLMLSLQPEVIDSLVNSAMIIRKTKHPKFTATTRMAFQTRKDNEQAGMVFYRTANSYYALMKDKTGISLIKKHLGKKEIIDYILYTEQEVYLRIEVDGLNVSFSYGEELNNLVRINYLQEITVISDNEYNKFNGPGIGVYATSNGEKSKNVASYHWFEYIENP